jgi:hypothetical protein
LLSDDSRPRVTDFGVAKQGSGSPDRATNEAGVAARQLEPSRRHASAAAFAEDLLVGAR